MTTMAFHRIEPEVAGGIGPGIDYDSTREPRLQGDLHYEFQGWLGDEIVTTSGFWIVTDTLAETLEASDLTGFELARVVVTVDDEYERMDHEHELPSWRRLVPTGTAGVEDFRLEGRTNLVVSDRALDLLRSGRLEHAELSPADEPVPVSPIMQRFLALRAARDES